MPLIPTFHNRHPIHIIEWPLTVFWFSLSTFYKFENNSVKLVYLWACEQMLLEGWGNAYSEQRYNCSILEHIQPDDLYSPISG